VLTVVALCLALLAPTLVLGAIFAMPKWAAGVAEARRRRLRRLGKLVTPAGPPLERLAADLRRLRIQRADPRRSRVQREGARLAYEDVIRQTATALDIAHDLDGTAGRFGREIELLRIEQALHDAGLVLT
jgi:hypothetical protein